MKQIILWLVLLTGSIGSAQAQASRYGFKAGFSLTSFTGDDTEGTGSKAGWHAGIVGVAGINERVSVQGEFLYSQKGATVEGRDYTGTFKGTQTLHYVDVPLLVKVKFNQVFLEAGPQAGMLVGAKLKAESSSARLSGDNQSAFKDLDFGYALGVGTEFSNGVVLGLRYNGGLSNIFNVGAEVRNSALQVHIGYMVGVK